MTTKLSTMLEKLDSISADNQIILKDFCEYMLSKDRKSDRHIASLLSLLISLDKFNNGLPFTSIDKKEQILNFLNHRYSQKEGKWVKREHDVEGKYISTFNCYRNHPSNISLMDR